MARGRAGEGSEGGQGKRAVRTGDGRLAAWLSQPDLVAVAAILLPGLGHVLQGRVRAGAGWCGAILLGYWAVFFPGAALHAISVLAAYRSALRRGNEGA